MGRIMAKSGEESIPRQEGLFTLLLITGAVLGMASLLLLVQASRVTTGYDIRRLETIRDDWEQKNFQVEAELATLRSLARIEREATTRLKMIPTTQHLYVEVNGMPLAKTTPQIQPSAHPQEDSQRSSIWGLWDWLIHSLRYWGRAEK